MMYPTPLQISTAITEPNARSGDTNHFFARKSKPIDLKNVFKRPLFGSSIDLNIMPMIRVDSTEGINTIPRCIFKNLIFLVRRSASASPIRVFITVVITVNARVFIMIFK